MAVYGHEKIRTSLKEWFPRVSLFLGPHSVGRWVVAEELKRAYGLDPADVLRVHALDVEQAQTIAQFRQTAPAASSFKLIIIDLYRASAQAKQLLGAVLNEPGYARIILIGEPVDIHPRMVSVCTVYRFRGLRSEDVAKILVHENNFSESRADELARRSGGQVAEAIKLANADDSIELVRKALHALRTHDEDALNELAPAWTDEATTWLSQWAYENTAGTWRVFDSDDFAPGHALSIKLLIALHHHVRPRLVVRSLLMGILKGD